jgi:sugar transferase (PEP-CTERM/EpsH1 system associated)
VDDQGLAAPARAGGDRHRPDSAWAGEQLTGQPPLVAHIIHRLAVGGLENGLVNLVNSIPADRYRHVIISLTDATDFRDRIHRANVPVIALHKTPGRGVGIHLRLWRLLRGLRPDIVHTRNLPTLEHAVTAAAAGVPARVHGEHGRDVYDLDGTNVKYNVLRRVVKPFIHHYIAVSRELEEWLIRTVGAKSDCVTRICNGVDADQFRPRCGPRRAIGPSGFLPPGTLVIGSVGRMEPVKDPLTLVRAFIHILVNQPDARKRVRLVMIGTGSLYDDARELLHAAGADTLAWLPGERDDISDLMRFFDVFVLPSLREGISNTILEAMASGLPIVATSVGGNPELVEEGQTGMLVPTRDPGALAGAINRYTLEPTLRKSHGQSGRRKAETAYSMTAMIDRYLSVYDRALLRVDREDVKPAAEAIAGPHGPRHPRGGVWT